MDSHDDDKPQQLSSNASPPENVNPAGSSPARERPERSGTWQADNLLGLINGVIVAVGGVFVTTSSMVITVIASVAALLIALTIILKS
ncbi:hypothetical protein AB0C27_54010 [Nonomuraea sp. NPDC048882]|uniref:hypothetical protein n=1 Tax=Nonomuraea sp. NPDC048882 TaxID=3154347 RepID=UPI0033F46AF6